MTLAVLSCANCGAPLTKQTGDVWPCLHCGALSRVTGETVAIEKKVPDEVMASLRQLVLAGKKDDAKRLAAQNELPPETVDQLTASITNSAIFASTLNWKGSLAYVGFLGLMIGGIYAVNAEFKAGWLLIILGGLNTLVFLPAMIRTIGMIGKPQGTATIRKATLVGENGNVHVYAFDVDIEPYDRSMGFRASMIVPSRASAVDRTKPGIRFRVRFAPDRSWIRYGGRID